MPGLVSEPLLLSLVPALASPTSLKIKVCQVCPLLCLVHRQDGQGGSIGIGAKCGGGAARDREETAVL